MAILAFGGEMGFFLPSDTVPIENASLGHDGSFARCSTTVHGSAAYVDTPAVSAQSNFWFHFDVLQDSGSSSSSTLVRLVEFLDSGGIARVRLTASWLSAGNDGTLQLETSPDGSTWTAHGNCNAAAGSRQTMDVHIVSNTASGSVDLYLGGTHRVTSGTVDLSGLTGITKARMWGLSRGIGVNADYSQVIMATETTIGMRVATDYMSGQGSTHTFDTGGYANIDEIAYSDADFVQSGTAGQIELFTGTSVFNFSGYSIRALALTARAKTDGTAPTKFRFQLKSGASTYDNGADLPLDFGYGNFCSVWETNPATGLPFTSTDIAGLQFGLKSVT